MEDEDFSWWDRNAHPEFEFILSGVHRRRLTPFAAPALTRHLAFWNATPPVPASEAQSTETEPNSEPSGTDPEQVRSRALAADRCLAEIYRCLLAEQSRSGRTVVDRLAVPDAVGDLIVLFTSAIDKNSGEIVEPERRDHIRTDSYRAVGFDFRWHGIQARLSFELHSEYVTMTTILELSGEATPPPDRPTDLYSEVLTTLTNVCEAEFAAVEAAAHEWRVRLYDRVWDEFSRNVFSCLKERIGELGSMFLDFRGLVVRPRPEEPPQDPPRFVPPLAITLPSRGPKEETPKLCEPHHLQRIWPLIHGLGIGSASDGNGGAAERTEYTVSLFLGGRAVYATALGSQASLLREAKPRPIYYFLYEDTLFAWQLGRLVYRIHRAGTARLAALMHFGNLRRAYQILSEIEKSLEPEITRPDDGSQVEFRRRLHVLNDNIETQISNIASLGLEPSLETRIERSRYYVEQFRATAAALRIRRVKGYQRYDEFVEQRLGPMFDYIDRLGKKFARLQQDRLMLISRMQAVDLQSETHLITKLQGSIAQTQRIADYGLSGVLGPYYMAYILSHALGGLAPARGVWLGALIFGPLIIVAIVRREEANKRAKRERAGTPLPSPPSSPASRKQAPGILERWRVRYFLGLGLGALSLGFLVDHFLTRWGYPSDNEAADATGLPILMLIWAAVLGAIAIVMLRQIFSQGRETRAIADRNRTGAAAAIPSDAVAR